MSIKFRRPNFGTIFLAVLVVFLMATGAFIGAANNVGLEANERAGGVLIEVPELEMVMYTEESDLLDSDTPESWNVQDDLGKQDINPVVPKNSDHIDIVGNEFEYTNVMDVDGENQVLNPDGTMVNGVMVNELDADNFIATDRNELTEGLSYITTDEASQEQVTQEQGATRTRSGSASISLGTDNDAYPGHGMGRVYGSRTSTTMYSYDYPYWYMYENTGTTDYKTWSVYDMSDLSQYKNVKITSGTIHYWHYYRYYLTAMEVWSMNSIPYEISGASTSAKGWFNEIGGTGSVKLAMSTFTGSIDSSRKDMWMTLTSGGITELNKRISSSNYDFAMGGIATKYSSSYGRLYMGDIRLELNFTYDEMPSDPLGEIAVGDTVAGYGYSSTKYDYYNYAYLYSSSSYVGYASWNATMIEELIPDQGPKGEDIGITSVSIRFNSDYISGTPTVTVYDMTNDPLTTTTWSTIFNDAGSGTVYTKKQLSGTVPLEKEWNLGLDALDDFNDTLDGSPDFFALGFTSTGYARIVSPKLVVTWEIIYPPTKTLQLGADNPEHAGHAMGYVRLSGTTYYGYSNHYAYPYLSSTSDYRGFAEFDLKDLTKWDGIKVTSAKLVMQNEYMRYFDTINFTALKTTMYETATQTIMKAVYNEAGSTGNIIGGHQLKIAQDNTNHPVEVELNQNAITALNAKLAGTPKYYTFGVGMHVKSLQKGYTTGYANWRDIRLVVTFEYNKHLQPTTGGQGIAFGDDLSGHVAKYTTSINYPEGYMEMGINAKTTEENRGYAHWDITKISGVFEQRNITDVIIKKVSLRFNHYSGTGTNVKVFAMKNNVTTATAATIFTDCGDGTQYYGPSSAISGADKEYEWDLGKGAVADFQDAFEDGSPKFFAVGMTQTGTSSIYEFSPKLVIEWRLPPPSVKVFLHDETPEGFEMEPIFFNANLTTNISGKTNGPMRFEWDWNNDKVFDYVSTSPLANNTWPDDFLGPITLRVNDTDTNQNTSKEFTVLVHNIDPLVDTSGGSISPQPQWEAESVNFSGYKVIDPAGINDTYTYFWDFDGDGEYDVSGPCNGDEVPYVVWFYDDDFLGEASLLVKDEDGGTSNITTKHKYEAKPPASGTGYVSDTGTKYVSSRIYVQWQYTKIYRRGWAYIDLSEIPEDGIIKKVKFRGTVSVNVSVNMVGVRLLTSDPLSADGATVFSEAGSGSRLFGLTWRPGGKVKDLTPLIETPAGAQLMEDALGDGYIGLGFDFESPKTFGDWYGAINGWSYDDTVKLDINYITYEPRYLFPIVVKNKAPIINCSNITISPKSLLEGDNVTITDVSFYDIGNDTYEYNLSVGDTYWTGWQSLGEWPVPGAGGTVNWKDNIALTGTPGASRPMTLAPKCWNDKILTAQNGWVSCNGLGNDNSWMEYKWSSPVTIGGFGIHQFRPSGTRQLIGCKDMQYWDGSKYASLGAYDAIADSIYTVGSPYYKELPKVVTTTRFRLYNLIGYAYPSGQVSNPSVSEWEVFSASSGGGPEEEVWVPNVCSSQVGNSNNVYPFGYPTIYNSWRYQQFYPKSELKKLDGKAITKITFRQDDSYARAGTVTYSGVEIHLNHLSSSTMASTFSSNYGTDRTKVFSGSFKWTLTTTSLNEVTIDVDDLFVYNKNNNLVFDIKITSMSGGTTTYPFDASSGGQSAGMIRVYSTSSSASSGSVGNSYGLVTKFTGGGGGGRPGWGAYGPGWHDIDFPLNLTIPDDHPLSGTIEDDLNVTLWIRDDDHNVFIPGKGIGPLEEPATVGSGYPYYSRQRKVVVDSKYNIYAIYYGYVGSSVPSPSTYYQIICGKSEDNGETWENYQVSSVPWMNYYQYYPAITIDSNDVLHAVWHGGSTSSTTYNIRYARSIDGGETWIDHYNITSSTSYSNQQVSICTDKDDTIHIVWRGRTSSSYYYNIHYINRTSTGLWSTEYLITKAPSSSPYLYQYYASIVADSKGNVHVVWYGYLSSTLRNYNIGYAVHWAANDTWSGIIQLTSDTSYYKYNPCITVAPNDDLHVVWYGTDTKETQSYQIMYRMYDSSTGKWGPREYLTSKQSYQQYPTVSVNEKGEVDVMWFGYKINPSGTPYALHRARKTTTGWDLDYNYYATSSYNYYPNLLCQPPTSVAEEGYAFIWYDGSVKFWTSEDFRMGTPEFTNGMAWCNASVHVKNVVPTINLTTMGNMSYAKEQDAFALRIFFEDPGVKAPTEVYETKIDWGDGTVEDWKVQKAYPVENLLKGRNPPTGSARKKLVEEHSFFDQPITYIKFKYSQPLYVYYHHILLEGFNTSTQEWEQIYYYHSTYGAPEFEQSYPIPYYNKWRAEVECYQTPTSTGYYEYEFRVEDFFLKGGYIDAMHVYKDDMPTGTPWDLLDVKIELREDDLGYDKVNYTVNVSTVPPELELGKILPDLSVTRIAEGDQVILDKFKFDDIAYDEPTENFEYQVDWGDGTVSPWMDEFAFTEDVVGYGGAGNKILYVVESAPPGGNDAWYFNWLNGQKKIQGWEVSAASWSSNPKYTDFDLIAISVNSATTYNRWKTVQTQMIDKGLRIMVVGNSAQEMLEPGRLDLANDCNHGYGGFYYNWIQGNYEGITTGYTGRVNVCNSGTGGSISGSTLAGPGHANAGTFDGQHLLSVLNSNTNYATQSIWTVWDSTNKTLSGQPLGTKVGFYGQYFSAANPTWTTIWDTMMGKTVNFLLGGSGPQSSIVKDDVRSIGTTANNGKKMVMDSENNMYVVYNNETVEQVFVGKSTDLGETWTQYEVTTDSSSTGKWQQVPAIAIDSKDNLHVVWSGQTTSNNRYNIRYARSTTGGVSWSNFKMVTTGSASQINYGAPSIAIDSNDKVHLSWFGTNPTYTNRNIYYINRTSTGTWGSIAMVTSDTANLGHRLSSIAVDTENNVHVSWYGLSSSTDTSTDIQYRKMDSATGVWGSKEVLTSVGSNSYPSMAVDLDDNVHIAWHTFPAPATVQYMQWDSFYESWGGIETVASDGVNNTFPTLGVDYRGFVYCAWSKYYPYAINFSMRDKVGWSEELPVSGDVYQAYFPSMMYGGGGSIVARGAALAYTAAVNSTSGFAVHMSQTSDFNLTDFGPWKGLPRLGHVYLDDNPSGTDRDDYILTLRMRDDDLGVTEASYPFVIENVLPEITSDVMYASGQESNLILPPIEFRDPGTGPNEKWHYWWDINNDGALGPEDKTGPVTDVTEVDGWSIGMTPEVKATINDDYRGEAKVWVYDDDTPLDMQYKGTIYLPGFEVTEATFEVYQPSNNWEEIDWSTIGYPGAPKTYAKDMSVYQNLAPWNTSATWATYAPSTTNMKYTPEDTLTLAERKALGIADPYPASGSLAHWEPFDITDLTQKWLDADANNYGITVMNTMVSNQLTKLEHTYYYASEATSTYRPKLTIYVDEDTDGIPDTKYVLQKAETKDGFIAENSLNKTMTEADFTSVDLLSNLYDGTNGSSIGAYYRRGLIEFNLEDIDPWRKPNEVVWADPPMNHTISVLTTNKLPLIIIPDVVNVLPFEDAVVDLEIRDAGSDDLYLDFTWGDDETYSWPGPAVAYFNNGVSPEPNYPPTHSAFNGTAPFVVNLHMVHRYADSDDYWFNITVWDDDGGFAQYVNKSVKIHVVGAKELKEAAAKMLEPLIPGHMALLGYENITLRYKGDSSDSTLLVYNYIDRAPYYWSEKLFLTVCNVKKGGIIEIDGSYLEGGIFGTEGVFGHKLILRLYNEYHQLIDTSEIPTAPTCINPLGTGQTYGDYTVLGFGEVNGISYQHYSKFALKTEDAMDHILRSINKDPRRGYGWWHQIWVWWCGYWQFRDLWLDNDRLDPQFGSVVFCEERWAARNLMEVALNCLHAEGVSEIEFEYQGKGLVDIEAYTLTDEWWNGSWKWIHREYDLKNGDTFILNASMNNSTKLGSRVMFRVYDAVLGGLNNVIYVRTSGEWPLEVMPGNIYDEWMIVNSSLLIGANYTWWHWWGDYNWWDLYFNFYGRGSRGCGWEVDECYDPKVANEEMERICSNLTVIWGAIKLLMTADLVIARVAYSDAENLTVQNSSYDDEYLYHMKMAKRYMYSGGREMDKGIPHHAITDFKKSWQNSILAMKYAFKSDDADSWEEFYDNCDDSCPCMYLFPWWIEWYIYWCHWENPEDNCNCGVGSIYEDVESEWYIAYEDLLKQSTTRCHLRLATPVISPNGGYFETSVKVTITCATTGSTIYYTTDGSTPTQQSTKYTGPITLTQATTLKAKAWKSGDYSAVASAVFSKKEKLPTPVISPDGGCFENSINVTITEGTTRSTTSAVIRYTLDGNDPTSSSTQYTGPFMLSATTTVKAKAFKTGWLDSDVASAEFVKKEKVGKPDILPRGICLETSTKVTITCSTPGATIYYTMDGSEPTESSTKYTGPIMVSKALTIKARAFKDGCYFPSEIAVAQYYEKEKIKLPIISPNGGCFQDSVEVTLTKGTYCCDMYYTLDGSTPTQQSTKYSGPFKLTETTTVKVKAWKTGCWSPSDVASATFTKTQKVATPTISPAGGYYEEKVEVTIGCTTSSATIYYTLDGSTPTTSSTKYTGPFTLTKTATVKAKAFKSGCWNPSDVAETTFTKMEKIATPVISPNGGSFETSQKVTITCATPGVMLYYTMDGTEPTKASIKYTGPFTLTKSATIKAKAFKVNWVTSDTAMAKFEIYVATPKIIPNGGSFETSVVVTLTISTPGATIYYTTDGNEPTTSSSKYTSPFTLDFTATVKAKAFKTGCTDSGTAKADFEIYVDDPEFEPNSKHETSVTVKITTTTPGATIYYTLDNSEPTESSIKYTGPFTLWVTTTVKAKAFKQGLTPSKTMTQKYEIYVAKPVISPTGGTFTEPVKVTITCSTPGAAIYYTDDGSTPTTSSMLYTGEFTLIRTTTIKAKAFKTGCTDSDTAEAKFTLKKFCDYDYNDWGMIMKETRKLHRWSKYINKIMLDFKGDVHRSGNNHEIHIAIDIDSKIGYKWEMKFYDDKDNLIDTKKTTYQVFGDFDRIIFNNTKTQVGYRTVLVIDFMSNIDPKAVGDAPYDPYMYDKTDMQYIHINTMQNISIVDSEDTDPNIAGMDVPMILVIGNTSWVPPMDQERIWNKYTRFDDWVYSGFTSYDDWYNM